MTLVPSSERKRNTYIGGPAAAAIAGRSPFATAADVYAAVVHGYEPKRTPRMLRGLIVEPGLLDYAAEYRQQRVARDCFYVDDKVPFFRCSPDGVEEQVARPVTLHSTKSTLEEGLAKWGPAESDDVDLYAWSQVQWEMGITGAREAHLWLLVLDADEEPRHYYVQRNREVIAEMRDAAEAFWWDHVVPQVPPDVAPKSDDAAAAMHPKGVPELHVDQVTEELIIAARAYDAARTVESMAEANKKTAGAVLKNLLGRAEHARWAGGSVSWRASPLEPKTNWEEVAHTLALMFRIPGEVFHGLVREQTRRAWTQRKITVHVTKQRNNKKGT